jgi:Response regulators consisting of a CheY-like receiver domain and a winged-helix DNA-binding domain
MFITMLMANSQLRIDYYSLLQKYGHQVTAYAKPDELFNKMKLTPEIDVLVTDHELSKKQKLLIEERTVSKVVQIIEPDRALSKADLHNSQKNADIYLTKPVDIKALTAVINSIYRHINIAIAETEPQPSKPKYRLCSTKRTIRLSDGDQINLTASEGIVLHALAQSAPHPVSRKFLSESLGQNFWTYDERKLEAIVSRLRRKINPLAPNLETIKAARGQGYQLLLNLTIG